MVMLNSATKTFLLFNALAAASSASSYAQDQPATREPAAPSAWVTKCTSAGKKDLADCSVERTMLLNQTGRFILSIVIRMPPQGREPGMMVHLPLGLFIPAGVTIQLDRQTPETLQVQTCDTAGCYAGVAVSSELLASMERAQHLTVSFQDLGRSKITVPVPLEGLTEAYQKIR